MSIDTQTYLYENPIGLLRHRFEEVIRRPTSGNQGIPQVIGRHGIPKLNDAPGQHCGRESHREAELDVVAGVVVAAGQVGVVSPAVAQPGIGPPGLALVLGQKPRPLALEEEYAFRQCVSVVVPSAVNGNGCEAGYEEKKKGGGGDSHG